MDDFGSKWHLTDACNASHSLWLLGVPIIIVIAFLGTHVI
jgi:hypothetical protein